MKFENVGTEEDLGRAVTERIARDDASEPGRGQVMSPPDVICGHLGHLVEGDQLIAPDASRGETKVRRRIRLSATTTNDQLAEIRKMVGPEVELIRPIREHMVMRPVLSRGTGERCLLEDHHEGPHRGKHGSWEVGAVAGSVRRRSDEVLAELDATLAAMAVVRARLDPDDGETSGATCAHLGRAVAELAGAASVLQEMEFRERALAEAKG